MKVEKQKAWLLIQQAQNMQKKDVPRSVFAHRAQRDLALHQLQAQDELFLEVGMEYEDFLRKLAELKLE